MNRLTLLLDAYVQRFRRAGRTGKLVLGCSPLLLACCCLGLLTPASQTNRTASTTTTAIAASAPSTTPRPSPPTATAVLPTTEPTNVPANTPEPKATEQPTSTLAPTNTPEPTAIPTLLVPEGTLSSRANLRAYPSTERGAVVAAVPAGSTVTIISTTPDRGWYAVRTSDGQTGYMSATVVNVVPEVAAAASVQDPGPPPELPTTSPAPAARGNCHPSYPDVCIPGGADLDCGEIAYRRFRVVGSDPHGFDRDNDGIGCESG